MTSWPDDVVARTKSALAPLADPDRAAGAFDYMKGVAPFLGIATPDRRRALRAAWLDLEQPTSVELGQAALALANLPQREYHYAAYDLLAKYIEVADKRFLKEYVEPLLMTVPWWDTVDGIGNAAITPLCRRFALDSVIQRWSESGDRWLIRAAIQHQRGRKQETDIDRILELCDRHWDDREFFVAKAIGWALRDIARMKPAAVRRFLKEHDDTNRVAIREARRGLGL